MPLLPGLDPQAEPTEAGQERAVKMGTALIKSLFGNLYGENPKFEGTKDGIQNFNGFVLNGEGERVAFLSFLRFGQGEFTDEGHVRRVLTSVNQLADADFPTPRYIAGRNQDLLLKVPQTVMIDGAMTPVPKAIKGGWATAQVYTKGTPVPNPIETLDQAKAMGQLLGRFHATGTKVFDDIGTMPSPGSPRALEQMLLAGLGLDANKSVAENLVEVRKPLSATALAIAKTIADLQRKINVETRILQVHPENPEKARRQASLKLVADFTEAMKAGWAERTLQDFVEAGKLAEKYNFVALPSARINGDFHSGNMFAERIMYDMGFLGDGIRIFDMCQALAISCHRDGKFWPEAAHAFVQGVHETCALTKQEFAALPEMMRYTYLRSTVTRFSSLIQASETQLVTKSPLELQARRRAYEEEVLASGKNWAEGAFASKEGTRDEKRASVEHDGRQ